MSENLAGDLIDGQWRRGQWGRLEKWTCIQCQWDTLKGLAAAREYAQNCTRCHPLQAENQLSPILVADKRGHIEED